MKGVRAMVERRWQMGLMVALCGALMLVAEASRAQSVWELSPYRVQLQVAFSFAPEWTELRRLELTQRLADRIDTLIGATWTVEVVEAERAWRSSMLHGLPLLGLEDLGETNWREYDKLLFVVATVEDGTWRLAARELDVRTQRWGLVRSSEMSQPERLRAAATELVLTTFSPLAMVEDVERDEVKLRLRAGNLPPRDESLRWVTEGDLFQPFIRYADRDGSLRRVVGLDWTFLRVEAVDGAELQTRTYSGLRSPLSARRRGRMEQLAVAVRAPAGETKLSLRSRIDPERPLAGYDVYAYGPQNKQTDLLGRTDRAGTIDIGPGSDLLRMVVVRSGNEYLARLPIVPGLQPALSAVLPDDTERLAAEGFITGLQESLVDLVVRREVLLALMRHYLSENRLEEASRLNDELNGLRTRQQFAIDLDREQQRTVSSDPSTQRKIDKLFADTKQLLNTFMRAGPVEEVQAELRAAMAQAGDARAAVEPERDTSSNDSATQ